MNIWENTVLTDQGKALQSKLLQGETLKIKRVATGAEKVPVVDLRQQTSVTEGGYDITLQPARMEGDTAILPVLLENKGLKESYELWQVGFYAEDPEEGEILFCIAQASQSKNIPSEAESPGFSITWEFCFNTSNTVPFEVILNSAGLVNIESYEVHTRAINEVNNRVDQLNADLKWKVHEVTKSEAGFYALPDNFSEIRFGVFVRLGDIVYELSGDYLKQELITGTNSLDRVLFLSGYCISIEQYHGGSALYFSAANNAVKVNSVIIDGGSHINSYELAIYYR